MVCLGLEPGVAGWKAQTNPLSYSGTPLMTSFYTSNFCNADSKIQEEPVFYFVSPHFH